MSKISRALISVTEKKGVLEFARGLQEQKLSNGEAPSAVHTLRRLKNGAQRVEMRWKNIRQIPSRRPRRKIARCFLRFCVAIGIPILHRECTKSSTG